MQTMRRVIAVTLVLLFLAAPALASGRTTAHGYFYIPAYSEHGPTAYALYAAALDASDAALYSLQTTVMSLITQFSGPSSPGTPYAYQIWADTGTGYLYQRNSANNAWNAVRLLDTTVPTATYGSNIYSVTYAPAITSYKEGSFYVFKGVNNTNSNATTSYFSANGLPSKPIYKLGRHSSYSLTPSDILSSQPAYLSYDAYSDYFFLLNPAGTLGPAVVTIWESQTAGTMGGTFTSGSWQTRKLNSINNLLGYFVTIGTNNFTLSPGVYFIRASAPAMQVNQHQAILYNVTDGTTALVGTSEASPTGAPAQSRSLISGPIIIWDTKVFEVLHRCGTTQATWGLGNAANLGQPEIYTKVEIWQE